jgi:hypothetical protein
MTTFNNRQLNSVFERIVKDKNGTLVRVRFTVVQIDGKFAPQVISITPFISEKPICLPCIKKEQVVAQDYTPTFIEKISPYFSLDFLMSQPTRAPSYR